jgi:hypothetical protein
MQKAEASGSDSEEGTLEQRVPDPDTMQIIVKTIEGKSATLYVKPDEDIRHLEFDLYDHFGTGFGRNGILLLFNGKAMAPDFTWKDYDVPPKSTLLLLMDGDGVTKIRLDVYMHSLKYVLRLDVGPHHTIDDVMDIIATRKNIPKDTYNLTNDGVVLSPEKIVSELVKGDESTILKSLPLDENFDMEIYVTVLSGKTFTLLVQPTHIVEFVKVLLRDALLGEGVIHKLQGVDLDLSFNGEILKSGRTLGECGITKGSTLHGLLSHSNFRVGYELTAELETKVPVNFDDELDISVVMGEDVVLAREEFRVTDTVSLVKRRIKEQRGYRYDIQMLTFKGQGLEDVRTLKHYNIGNKAILRLTVAQVGDAADDEGDGDWDIRDFCGDYGEGGADRRDYGEGDVDRRDHGEGDADRRDYGEDED